MKRALITALLLIGTLAAGCGDDGGGSGTDRSDGGGSGDPAAEADGSGDSGEPGTLPQFCELLTAEQVSEAVGAPVTLETGPFDACEFSQEDPRAASGSLGVVEVGADNGGFEGYRSGASATLTNAVEHAVEGAGEEAFVTTGTFGESESLQAGGGALVDGGRVYTVNVAQSAGLTEEDLVGISERLITLLVDVG